MPEFRKREIMGAKNDGVRLERYTATRLLEYALWHEFGKDLSSVGLCRAEYGGIECDLCHLSVSHRDGIVAVAFASEPIGIDVEKKTLPSLNIASRILTSVEAMEYELLTDTERADYLLRLWTRKEAIFKSLGEKFFHPRHIETKNFFTEAHLITVEGGEHLLTAASRNAPIDSVQIFYPEGIE